MSEFLVIDSPLRGYAMPKSYSADLRERVIEAVEIEGASRREAAERFGVVSVRQSDGCSAGTRAEARAETARRKRISVGTACGADIGAGGRTTGPDLEGDRCGTAQAADSNQQECGLAVFRSTRHHLQKKACERQNSSDRTSPGRGGAGFESKACLIRPGWCLSTRLRSPPTWCGSGAALRGASCDRPRAAW